MFSVTIPNITPSQNTPVLPNIRRMVTRPSGASCSRRNSAKLSLATILRSREASRRFLETLVQESQQFRCQKARIAVRLVQRLGEPEVRCTLDRNGANI